MFEGVDWWNASITCLSVFVGAGLAHLSAWYINNRQFEKNMTIEKDNQDRLSKLEYWEEVYVEIKTSLKATSDFKKECKKIVDVSIYEFDLISDKELIYNKSCLSNIHADLVIAQCSLQFLMYRIQDNACFESEYNTYKAQSNTLYMDVEKIFNDAYGILEEIENYKKADDEKKKKNIQKS